MRNNTADAPIVTLPLELLQTVWRHLPFVDLLHCQQVCTLWKAYPPRTDPALCTALSSEIADPDEGEAMEYCGILFDLKQELTVRRGQLPELKFVLSADSDEHWGEFGRTKHACFHPLVGNLGKYMDVVHPRFERRKDEDVLSFSFLDFKGSKKLAEPVKCESAS
ncbi:hypothetical protein E8E11_000344 [Didymella keratinophila]|nr:hypothetical protein E8E11_000344 [Didymella keratinophila]